MKDKRWDRISNCLKAYKANASNLLESARQDTPDWISGVILLEKDVGKLGDYIFNFMVDIAEIYHRDDKDET